MRDHQGFFKSFKPKAPGQKMKIPAAFMAIIGGTLPDKVYLRDCYGNQWGVHVKQVGNDWSFTDGWAKFICDNSLDYQDVLVFEFNGDCMFDVKMLGHDTCDKGGVEFHKYNWEEGEREYEDDVEEGQGELDSDDEDEEGEMNNDDENQEGEGELKDRYDDVEEEVEEENDDDAQLKPIAFGVGTKKLCRGYSDTSGTRRPRKSPIDCRGAKLLKAGLLKRTTNPYFVTEIRNYKICELFIPRKVIKNYNLELPSKMHIVDPVNKRRWETVVVKWKDGRIWLEGGWDKFCQTNFLNDGDKCFCEFVPSEVGRGLDLEVSIINGASMA